MRLDDQQLAIFRTALREVLGLETLIEDRQPSAVRYYGELSLCLFEAQDRAANATGLRPVGQ
jgi:hypothetical protein